MQVCIPAYVWRSEDNLQALVLSFFYEGPRDPSGLATSTLTKCATG